MISGLQDLIGNTTQGGRVWFYSPGGIVVGATAVFNVGSLLLTVNDPISFSNTANGFTGNFVAGANSTASVTIEAGADQRDAREQLCRDRRSARRAARHGQR